MICGFCKGTFKVKGEKEYKKCFSCHDKLTKAQVGADCWVCSGTIIQKNGPFGPWRTCNQWSEHKAVPTPLQDSLKKRHKERSIRVDRPRRSWGGGEKKSYKGYWL